MSKPWPEKSPRSSSSSGKPKQFSPRQAGLTKPRSTLDKVRGLPEPKRNLIALGTAGVITFVIASFWGVSKIYEMDQEPGEGSSVFGSGLSSIKDQMASAINSAEEEVFLPGVETKSTLQEEVDAYREQNVSLEDIEQSRPSPVLIEKVNTGTTTETAEEKTEDENTTDKEPEIPPKNTSHIGRPVLIATTSAQSN